MFVPYVFVHAVHYLEHLTTNLLVVGHRRVSDEPESPPVNLSVYEKDNSEQWRGYSLGQVTTFEQDYTQHHLYHVEYIAPWNVLLVGCNLTSGSPGIRVVCKADGRNWIMWDLLSGCQPCPLETEDTELTRVFGFSLVTRSATAAPRSVVITGQESDAEVQDSDIHPPVLLLLNSVYIMSWFNIIMRPKDSDVKTLRATPYEKDIPPPPTPSVSANSYAFTASNSTPDEANAFHQRSRQTESSRTAERMRHSKSEAVSSKAVPFNFVSKPPPTTTSYGSDLPRQPNIAEDTVGTEEEELSEHIKEIHGSVKASIKKLRLDSIADIDNQKLPERMIEFNDIFDKIEGVREYAQKAHRKRAKLLLSGQRLTRLLQECRQRVHIEDRWRDSFSGHLDPFCAELENWVHKQLHSVRETQRDLYGKLKRLRTSWNSENIESLRRDIRSLEEKQEEQENVLAIMIHRTRHLNQLSGSSDTERKLSTVAKEKSVDGERRSVFRSPSHPNSQCKYIHRSPSHTDSERRSAYRSPWHHRSVYRSPSHPGEGIKRAEKRMETPFILSPEKNDIFSRFGNQSPKFTTRTARPLYAEEIYGPAPASHVKRAQLKSSVSVNKNSVSELYSEKQIPYHKKEAGAEPGVENVLESIPPGRSRGDSESYHKMRNRSSSNIESRYPEYVSEPSRAINALTQMDTNAGAGADRSQVNEIVNTLDNLGEKDKANEEFAEALLNKHGSKWKEAMGELYGTEAVKQRHWKSRSRQTVDITAPGFAQGQPETIVLGSEQGSQSTVQSLDGNLGSSAPKFLASTPSSTSGGSQANETSTSTTCSTGSADTNAARPNVFQSLSIATCGDNSGTSSIFSSGFGFGSCAQSTSTSSTSSSSSLTFSVSGDFNQSSSTISTAAGSSSVSFSVSGDSSQPNLQRSTPQSSIPSIGLINSNIFSQGTTTSATSDSTASLPSFSAQSSMFSSLNVASSQNSLTGVSSTINPPVTAPSFSFNSPFKTATGMFNTTTTTTTTGGHGKSDPLNFLGQSGNVFQEQKATNTSFIGGQTSSFASGGGATNMFGQPALGSSGAFQQGNSNPNANTQWTEQDKQQHVAALANFYQQYNQKKVGEVGALFEKHGVGIWKRLDKVYRGEKSPGETIRPFALGLPHFDINSAFIGSENTQANAQSTAGRMGASFGSSNQGGTLSGATGLGGGLLGSWGSPPPTQNAFAKMGAQSSGSGFFNLNQQ